MWLMTQYRSSEGQDSWKAPTQLKGSALLSNAVQLSLPDGNIITIELSLGGHFNKLENSRKRAGFSIVHKTIAIE